MASTQSPTKDQAKGVEAFTSFLPTEDKVFVLSGGAGVGKTWLMGHIKDTVLPAYEKMGQLLDVNQEKLKILFTATTNKAAEVLADSLGAQAQTIQSFLSLTVKEDYKTGKTFLTKTPNWKVHRGYLVFIDEASMIDKALFNIILESFEDSKIVFVGDHAQMAPVGESLSEAFSSADPLNFIHMTQPVRNAGQPALMNLCAQLRNTVETGIFTPIEGVPGVIDYLSNDEAVDKITEVFSDPDAKSRVLCYTNSRVQAYNGFIREDVRQLPPQFTPGELLVVGSTFSPSKEVTVNVERLLKVLEVSSLDALTFSDEYAAIPYRQVSFASEMGTTEILNAPVAEDHAQVTNTLQSLTRRKQWHDYFQLKNTFIDVRDRYASTVYKAQGSTYESVFIDLGNIGTSFDVEQVARMLFVAASRATTRVYLIGQLEGRYHDSRGKALWQSELPSLMSSGSPNASVTTSLSQTEPV